jgi:hypothetical protein
MQHYLIGIERTVGQFGRCPVRSES